ncbi:MAG: hypothetical protein QOG91_328 [Candidatus Parcubacteria bacterium]|jgi:hypothetical protein|nr:hypothetical protein [Candidatus Parcubacteria bacterium]
MNLNFAHSLYFVIGFTFAATIVFASFGEWTLHRYIMHKRSRIPWLPWLEKLFNYAFSAHQGQHHRRFPAKPRYQLQAHEPAQMKEDEHNIAMAWWNALVLVPVVTVLFSLVPAIPYICVDWWPAVWAIVCTEAFVFTVYYAVYEYIHWCMHVPKERLMEMHPIIIWLNGHHLIHHLFYGKNLNVVLPLADWLLGTLVLRSPVKFDQPIGPAVPNVQPQVENAGVGVPA